MKTFKTEYQDWSQFRQDEISQENYQQKFDINLNKNSTINLLNTVCKAVY